MNAGKVCCNWPGECRCLRKEQRGADSDHFTVLLRGSRWLLLRESICWLTIKQSVAFIIFCNPHPCPRDNELFFRWLLVAHLIFPPRCCSRLPRGPLYGMPRSACRSWDWWLSFLEFCQVQLHPVPKRLRWPGHLQAANCQYAVLEFGCDVHRDKSSLCSYNMFLPKYWTSAADH